MCKYIIPETFDDINFLGYYYKTFWTLASKLGHFIIVHLVKLNSLVIKKELENCHLKCLMGLAPSII
jgi:hypothetical protein